MPIWTRRERVLQKAKQISDKIDGFNSLYSDWEDLKTLVSLGIEDGRRVRFARNKGKATKIFAATLEKMSLETLLSGQV